MKKVMTGKQVVRLILAGSGLLLVGISSIATAATEKGLANDGATLLDSRCSVCHSADRPKRAHKTPDEWEQTVSRMIGKGAQLSASEKKILLDHLSKTYGR